MGIGPGDRVMIVLPNVPQMIIAYYATLKIGGVVVLPNTDADQAQITHAIDETKAEILITLNEFSLLAKQVLENNSVKVVFADIVNATSVRVYTQLLARWKMAGLSPSAGDEWEAFGTSMEQLMIDAPREPPEVEVASEDLAAILYTSGTTDDPKGVCLTHYNLVANALQTRPSIILLPVFELQQVLEHIKEYEPTFFPGVPSIYMAINNAPDVSSYGLSSIKLCISGAAPLPVEVQEKFEKLTKGRLLEGYGLTEASPVTHFNPVKRTDKTGSIGIPLPNTDARIIDLITGEDVPPGQIGELLIRGPQVMQGYWETEKTDEAESVIKEGWLYTGDVAVMDNEGFFKIISRKRDTIMAGEYSVFPRDVEEVLYENSKVMEAAVVGISTEDAGEKVKAFIVPRPGTSLSKEELLDLCRKRLEEYAVPWEIEFREELPKSFIGKVLRRMLTE
jgi:long-chain acyl-CoA synthetase